MKYVIRDSEAGNVIESFATEAEALEAIKQYEEEDKRNGEYSDGFYEVAIEE